MTDPIEERETPLESASTVSAKRQIWLILIVMVASFCAGTLVLFGILWVL
jgi:hypothetical protein